MHTQVVASSLRSHYHHYILNIGTCVCSGCCHMWCSSLCFLLSKNAVDMLTLHQHQVSGFQSIAFQIVVIISVLQQKCTRLQFLPIMWSWLTLCLQTASSTSGKRKDFRNHWAPWYTCTLSVPQLQCIYLIDILWLSEWEQFVCLGIFVELFEVITEHSSSSL